MNYITFSFKIYFKILLFKIADGYYYKKLVIVSVNLRRLELSYIEDQKNQLTHHLLCIGKQCIILL